jgi:multidrug efflux system membrane fusion protein
LRRGLSNHAGVRFILDGLLNGSPMDDRTTTDFAKPVRTQPVKAEPAKPHAYEPPPLDPPVTPKPGKSKAGRRFGLLILVGGAAAAGWWFYGRQPQQQQSPAQQQRGGGGGGRFNPYAAAMPVVVAPAVTGDIDINLNALGTVTSLATVTIKSQISGYLTNVIYQEGQVVKKGDLLAEIDDRSYKLALQNAEGALARDVAMLQSAELDLKRYQDLAKTNAISRQQLDQQVALVAQDKANILSDQAQIETQKLNIVYCHIVAPVNGRVGLRLVDQGNYVTPGDATGLVVITQFQPISVVFPVAEDNQPPISKRLKEATTLPATAFDRSDKNKLAAGDLKTIDNQIDTTTGTFRLRALFANDDESLFPNQFVNVHLLVDTLKGVTVIPTAAIQRGAPGTYVYLLGDDETVTVKPVKLRLAIGGQVASSGDRVAVEAGLSPGDRVVIDGADKLRNGAKVVPRDAGSGTPAAAPGAAPASGATGSDGPAASQPGSPPPRTGQREERRDGQGSGNGRRQRDGSQQ